MRALDLAKTAYGMNSLPVRTDRGTEYALISRVTGEIRKSMEGARLDFSGLARALHKNRKLWTILASDVSNPENGLTKELRARIFFLAEYVDAHTSKVLRGEGDAGILIEINVAMMRGLGSGRAVK